MLPFVRNWVCRIKLTVYPVKYSFSYPISIQGYSDNQNPIEKTEAISCRVRWDLRLSLVSFGTYPKRICRLHIRSYCSAVSGLCIDTRLGCRYMAKVEEESVWGSETGNMLCVVEIFDDEGSWSVFDSLEFCFERYSEMNKLIEVGKKICSNWIGVE